MRYPSLYVELRGIALLGTAAMVVSSVLAGRALAHSLIAQIPGASDAVDAAMKSGHGYEAVVLVVVMLFLFGLLGYLARSWLVKSSEREDRVLEQAVKREEKLSDRVTELDTFVREALLTTLQETTKAIAAINTQTADSVRLVHELRESMHSTRPCFWSEDRQRAVIASVSDRVADSMTDMIEERLLRWQKQHPSER